jgi:hypothetical protein
MMDKQLKNYMFSTPIRQGQGIGLKNPLRAWLPAPTPSFTDREAVTTTDSSRTFQALSTVIRKTIFSPCSSFSLESSWHLQDGVENEEGKVFCQKGHRSPRTM